MQTITHEIALDFTENRSLITVPAVQDDRSGRVIDISLYHNGERVNVTSSDNVTLTAYMDNIAIEDELPLTVVDNKIHVPLVRGLTQVAGVEHCIVKISSGNGIVHTARFDIDVEKSVIDESYDIIKGSDMMITLQSYLADYIKSAAKSLRPSSTLTTKLTIFDAEAYENPYREIISGQDFDCETDGLLIWNNGVELITSDRYTFDTTTYLGAVGIQFQNYIFQDGDSITYMIYKNSGSSGTVWHGLSAIGLSLAAGYTATTGNITANGTGTIENMGTAWNNARPYIDSWYDVTEAVAHVTEVSVYGGGQLPPAIYVPTDNSVYQNGIFIPHGFYVILGDDNMLCRYEHPSTEGYIGFAYYVSNAKTHFNWCILQASGDTELGKKCSSRKDFYQGSSVEVLSVLRSGVEKTLQTVYTGGEELVALMLEYANWTLSLT